MKEPEEEKATGRKNPGNFSVHLMGGMQITSQKSVNTRKKGIEMKKRQKSEKLDYLKIDSTKNRGGAVCLKLIVIIRKYILIIINVI